MGEKITGPETTADALTQQLVQANKFDPDGLEANRQGKISANQQRTIMEALGLGMALLFAILALVLACGIGFNSLNAENWSGAAIPIAIGVVLFGGIGYLILLTKRTGTDKYLTNRRDALPRLLLMGVDLIRSNVMSIAGNTTRSHQQRINRSRDSTGNETESQVDLYSYSVDGREFYVEEAGYEAFPEWGLRCRVYYLPLSKSLVNIEAVESIPLSPSEVPPVLVEKTATPYVSSADPLPVKVQTADGLRPHNPVTDVMDSIKGGVARAALSGSQAERMKAMRSLTEGALGEGLASSPVFQLAMQVACADERLVAALGEPIQAGKPVTGSISRVNLVQKADLVIPISGARKRGKLFVSARSDKDTWQFHMLEARVDGEAAPIPLGH